MDKSIEYPSPSSRLPQPDELTRRSTLSQLEVLGGNDINSHGGDQVTDMEGTTKCTLPTHTGDLLDTVQYLSISSFSANVSHVVQVYDSLVLSILFFSLDQVSPSVLRTPAPRLI